MKIFILTYGRADNQQTWNNLPLSIKAQTTLVVQAREKHLYKDYPHIVLPADIQRISPTRQYILYQIMKGGGKFVMLDDDLKFAVRREDDSTKFYPATARQIANMFAAVEDRLDHYIHVGVLAREGGNRATAKYKLCTRMMRVLAYNATILQKLKVRFDRLPLQQDFDMTLQLLRKGYPNLVLCDWVQDQAGSNAKGGCSTFRTIEMLNENAKNLAMLHHPFVKTVEKQTKSSWGGKARLDVVVQWKKAYESFTGKA